MFYTKILVIILFTAFVLSACFSSKSKGYSITESKAYEASLFRQLCAICHGAEGEGKTTDQGLKVPSLRDGEFKFHTEDEIYRQIANGGNGMTPFRSQLTDNELHMMAAFVHDQLRRSEK
jgi:mono/diheme cytochrome c family protein